MNLHRETRSLHIFIVFLCGSLTAAAAATEPAFNSNTHAGSTSGEPVSSATPPPDGTEGATEPTGVSGTTEAGTPHSEADTTWTTEAPSATTEQPVVTPEACSCDLTPGFCDIGCCCDTVDCDVANLSTIFTGCPQKAISGVCLEKWLMFRANVDSSLVTLTDTLFCIRTKDNASQSLPCSPPYPALGDSYHFSPPASLSSSHSRGFYRVDDVIQTYFSSSSVRGVLRQPSPGAAAAFCFNRNPAKFLRSMSLSCTRTLTRQSCTADPTLNARSYFSDMSLIKVPIVEMLQVSDFLIPVTPLSDWPSPREHNGSCVNVVKKVEFVIGYTGRGELTYASVNVALADVGPDESLLQTHSVHFQLEAPTPTPAGTSPAAGLRKGSPVIGRFDIEVKPLTTLGVSQGGECSSDPSRRAPILFTHNTITGCTLSLSSGNCSELRSHIYAIMQGPAPADVIAMNFGSQPDWARVLNHECPISVEETCESGCTLPYFLSIRVLWARQGLLDLPQNHILGAKYLFQCKTLKCPASSPIALTTEVTFADITVYPEPPRGAPRPEWKFPFGFFTQGTAELDGHVVINGTEKVTWSLMLFTLMLLMGLEFFTR